MSFFLQGIIRSVPRLKYGKQECYGLMQGLKNKFVIKISDEAVEEGQVFADTMLHELLHLYFWILKARGVKGLSDPAQHEILEEVLPIVLSRIALILKRRKKA